MSERQQVNLYQPVADASNQPFSARTAGFAIAAMAGTIVLIWGYGAWQVSRLQSSVEELSARQRKEDEAVAALGSMHAARANPEELQARIKELTGQIALRRKALERLKQGGEGRRTGFAPALEGLARSHVEGLWLSHLVLSGSAGMTLEGTTLDADLVPRYLHGLSADPALSGERFDELVIERKNGLKFRARSNLDNGSAGGDAPQQALQAAPAPPGVS
jgi:hypothetical protein